MGLKFINFLIKYDKNSTDSNEKKIYLGYQKRYVKN